MKAVCKNGLRVRSFIENRRSESVAWVQTQVQRLEALPTLLATWIAPPPIVVPCMIPILYDPDKVKAARDRSSINPFWWQVK